MRSAPYCGISPADETEEWSYPSPAWQSAPGNHGGLPRRSKGKQAPRDGQHSSTGIADRGSHQMAVPGIQNTSNTFRSPLPSLGETEYYQNRGRFETDCESLELL